MAIEWRESNRQLTAADVDRLETLLAALIARAIFDETISKEHAKKNDVVTSVTAGA